MLNRINPQMLLRQSSLNNRSCLFMVSFPVWRGCGLLVLKTYAHLIKSFRNREGWIHFLLILEEAKYISYYENRRSVIWQWLHWRYVTAVMETILSFNEQHSLGRHKSKTFLCSSFKINGQQNSFMAPFLSPVMNLTWWWGRYSTKYGFILLVLLTLKISGLYIILCKWLSALLPHHIP